MRPLHYPRWCSTSWVSEESALGLLCLHPAWEQKQKILMLRQVVEINKWLQELKDLEDNSSFLGHWLIVFKQKTGAASNLCLFKLCKNVKVTRPQSMFYMISTDTRCKVKLKYLDLSLPLMHRENVSLLLVSGSAVKQLLSLQQQKISVYPLPFLIWRDAITLRYCKLQVYK